MNNYNKNEDNHGSDDAADYFDNVLYLYWHCSPYFKKSMENF